MKNISKLKVIAIIVIGAIMAACLTGCQYRTGNRIVEGLDVQTFNYAYVYCGDKQIVEGCVSQWRDYENSDTIQVQIKGKFYLTHYTNVVLISDPEMGGIQYGGDWN